MSYNLNFYPNDFNQNNMYSPYLDRLQQNTNNTLQQIQQLQNQLPVNQPNTPPDKQPYYLYCGVKEDWQDFLLVNYGITEQAIFEDYKLYLQAKLELQQERGQSKINTMKDRLRNKGGNINVDSTVQSSIKPIAENQYISNSGCDINTGIRDNNEPVNGLREQTGFTSKQINKKGQK